MELDDVKSMVFLLLMILVVEVVGGSQCISSYQQLETIFRSSSENYDNISEAFYVTNRVSSHYVVVNYHTVQCSSYDNFTGCTAVDTEQWIWSHSVVHLLFHPYSLYYLSLRYDDTNDRTAVVYVTVPVVCHDNKDRLLSRLTQLVSLKWECSLIHTVRSNTTLLLLLLLLLHTHTHTHTHTSSKI